eukprot:6719456-Pyramimonas_sp.AAC.1
MSRGPMAQKWKIVTTGFETASELLKATTLTLWMFTRSTDLIQFAISQFGQGSSCIEDHMGYLERVVHEHCQGENGWQKRMRPRSRDYSIDTSSLQGSSDRYTLRAAPVVYT